MDRRRVLTERRTAGTDLGLLRTKAEPQGDGACRSRARRSPSRPVSADMADDVVHLVLARLRTRLLVEGRVACSSCKFLVNADGWLGARNVYCGGLEHKMGVTATPRPDGVWTVPSAPWWASPPRSAAMFVMMNGARLGVGDPSLGLTQVAYENAVNYAKDRVQMRVLVGCQAP